MSGYEGSILDELEGNVGESWGQGVAETNRSAVGPSEVSCGKGNSIRDRLLETAK
jgi:hypothetical protein